MSRLDRLMELSKKATDKDWWVGLSIDSNGKVAGRKASAFWAEGPVTYTKEQAESDALLISEMRNTLDDFLELATIAEKVYEMPLQKYREQLLEALKKLKGEG